MIEAVKLTQQILLGNSIPDFGNMETRSQKKTTSAKKTVQKEKSSKTPEIKPTTLEIENQDNCCKKLFEEEICASNKKSMNNIATVAPNLQESRHLRRTRQNPSIRGNSSETPADGARFGGGRLQAARLQVQRSHICGRAGLRGHVQLRGTGYVVAGQISESHAADSRQIVVHPGSRSFDRQTYGELRGMIETTLTALSAMIVSTFVNYQNVDFVDSFDERVADSITKVLTPKIDGIVNENDGCAGDIDGFLKRSGTANFSLLPVRYQSQVLDDADFNPPVAEDEDLMLGKRKNHTEVSTSKSAKKSVSKSKGKNSAKKSKTKASKNSVQEPQLTLEERSSMLKKQLTFGNLPAELLLNDDTTSLGRVSSLSNIGPQIKMEAFDTGLSSEYGQKMIAGMTQV